ncbi:MAG: quinone-dependent dihydroorotate dehydrogenase [Gammaproteobacteria bacterium]|nr:quinone-dependent dihydroorotate dehydrogenase [Gammaproteobacteria bacterium]
MYPLIRSLLFALPPEWAHLVVLKLLSKYNETSGTDDSRQSVSVGHLKCANRVGLAAGFDKDGLAIEGLSRLGFGFLEFGAVTPRIQAGNPHPRIFRLKNDLALINRLGFNNNGVDALAQKLSISRNSVKIPIGVNIGKNTDTSNNDAVTDFAYCFNQVKSVSDFVTVNISSPNTSQLRDLQSDENIVRLLGVLVGARDAHFAQSKYYVSLFVKISPDMEEDETVALCRRIKDAGCDGIVATNTTTNRPAIRDRRRDEDGGLSGKPLLPLALRAVRIVRSAVGPTFPVIGCGGVWDAESAKQMIKAGADLVQIYTSLIYRGPRCISEMAVALGQKEQIS